MSEVFDTTGFTYGSSGGPVGSPLHVEAFSLTGSDVNQGHKYMEFNNPVGLNTGGYLIVFNLIPSAANGAIQIANDHSINQLGSAAMQTNSGGWFSNFANSLTFNAPHIRAVLESDPSVNFNLNHVTCPYDSTGSITAVISTPGSYSYQWSNGDTTPMADSLKPGFYTLNLTSVSTTYNYTVEVISESDPITYSAIVQDEKCLNTDDGSITVNAQGTGPLSFMWNTSDTTPSIQNLSPGAYSLTITDSLGCSKNLSFIVDSSSSSIAKPFLTISDTMVICEGDSISLGVTTSYVNYQWSDNSATSAIHPGKSGDYYVKVDNGGSCHKYSDTLHLVVREPYDSLEICMVSFDYNSNRNKVLFQNPQIGSIDSIVLLQKEDPSAQNFSFAGHITGASNEVYDTVHLIQHVFPVQQYALRVTDTCGNQSDLSPVHTSMTLGTSKNANGNAELSWTPYLGNPVSKYRIYKTTAQFNSFTLIDSVASAVNNYVDQNANDSDYYYLVEAVFGTTLSCNNAPFDGSIVVTRYNPLGMSENTIDQFKVFPNPIEHSTTIVNPENTKRTYELSSMAGKLIQTGILKPGENHTDLSYLSKGVYLFRIPGKAGVLKITKN
ncbi:MAG: T9SS type A sorting domain-containing protein [Owenweeksia sp.]|nr:T9SS type A sorting domain-containing protein [Owenweeksia sp.]